MMKEEGGMMKEEGERGGGTFYGFRMGVKWSCWLARFGFCEAEGSGEAWQRIRRRNRTMKPPPA